VLTYDSVQVDPWAIMYTAGLPDVSAMQLAVEQMAAVPGKIKTSEVRIGFNALPICLYSQNVESRCSGHKAGGAHVMAFRLLPALQVLNAMLLGALESNSPMDAVFTKRLLTAGAAADTWAPSGLSALMIASRRNKVQMMELLINRQKDAPAAAPCSEYEGADVQLADGHRRTALMHAAEKDHLDAIQLLLAHGAQVQFRAADHRMQRAMHDS
jgi:Ankyrin repeats (3 copies)